ncbi:MAG: site-specific DNA-methyltransferase [Candidatus Heimdallarchaeota archaeon]|nr:site-specific DNA-methyltransferase [Candidatus Heimdallarchaeota archaeon]
MKNIILENDNIIALTELNKHFPQMIDLIVIDPPYNTNIEHIGYRDSNFKDGWISFIEPRLKLGYTLLSKVGVMFIHIDENELINLTNLCYEIFGINNVNILVWKKVNNHFDQNRIHKSVNNIKSTHEYILLCYRNKKNTKLTEMKQPIYENNNWIEILTPMESILDNLGTTSSAKDEINELLGSREAFSTPKPMRLIKEMVRVSTHKYSIILDFFAGSGTTGHAVLDLNKEDGGKRKFILVTNNESDICRKVTVPRISKAIEINGYNAEFKVSAESSIDNLLLD